MSQLIPSTTPLQQFKGHEERVRAVAVFPDKRRMVTGSHDNTVRLWDLKTGEVLKKMEGHSSARVRALAVSRDGRFIASGGYGEVIIWHGETGESLTKPFKTHSDWINSLDFSPDGTVLATGSWDNTTKLWNTKTWKQQGKSIKCGSEVHCVRYSPSGQLLAIATDNNIQIYNAGTRERIKSFKAHKSYNLSLAWTPNGTRLLSGGNNSDPTIREWDAWTWQQVGDRYPCTGHTHKHNINALAINPSGTLAASASDDTHVRLWRLSDRQTIAIFKHSSMARSLTFSVDGTHILSGGKDKMISEWAVPKDALPEDALKELASEDTLPQDTLHNEAIDNSPIPRHVSILDPDNVIRASFMPQILSINTTARNACIAGDLSNAEQLFTQEINTDASNYNAYANRSFIMSRTHHWDHALQDAIKSIAIQPSLTGYISKGIALYGKGDAIAMFNADQHEEALILLRELAAACPNNDTACLIVEAYLRVELGNDAMNDVYHNDAADHFTAAVNSNALSSTSTIHPMYKDFVVLFGWDLTSLWQNAHQKRCDALLRAGRLEDALESYRHMMDKGDKNLLAHCLDWSNAFAKECSALFLANGDAAFAAGNYDNAFDLYSSAIDLDSASDTTFAARSKAKAPILAINARSLLFQKWCDMLLRAGRLEEALKLYRHLMDICDESTKASCLDWSNGKSGQECSTLCLAGGDAALVANEFDRAINLCSLAIELNSTGDAIFATRSKAKLGKVLWEDALLDAQKVIELSPSSHVGFELKHAALRGAQRYDEAIEAFEIMLSALDNAPESHIQKLRQQYVSPSQAEDAIGRLVWIELENAPFRLLNTSTGLLCNRAAQMHSFKISLEYKKLLSFTTTHSDLQMSRIKDVVKAHFRCVLLSHRWEEPEALLHDVHDKVVYELNKPGGIVKLQSFCRIARDAGYSWAWMDTCCIDKNSNTELQESINSMFVWYRHSALTIVYLCDVPPSSQSGALASSAWNGRGWTFQEFVAPKVVIFYQNDWSLYLDDRSPNHKESPAIMKELEDAMGIDRQALVAFRPGMRGAREKLHWASMRITTVQEDVAYSLFGIFNITLPVIYGEKKQRALGRLLQEIVAQSGDITVLDWVGQPSEFNSCLPADIISYIAPPCALPSLSEDEIQRAVSSLQNTQAMAVQPALKLYAQLENMSAPHFANRRLHLPCIAFRVTEVRRRRGQATHFTYGVKADGLRDLVITTDETLIQFSQARPIQQTFFLVRLWDRRLLELPDFGEQLDFAGEEESVRDLSDPESPLDDSEELPGGSPVEVEPVHLESHSRALRLMVRLVQPFSAFLLAQQRVGEYKRIATDHYIIAQVRDVASAHDMMDIKTLDIL
ncbi:hypothetical protein EDB19DRAFT_1912066 [Suillus lakei]|nr:hypothetical protein EDB19DRAFT_1912066 [Suillus lakei]